MAAPKKRGVVVCTPHVYREDYGRMERRVERVGTKWDVIESFIPRVVTKKASTIRHRFRSVADLMKNFPEFTFDELCG